MCKRLTLQFVISKPFLAGTTLLLFAAGKWEEGVYSINSGFLYITILYNVAYTGALVGWVLCGFSFPLPLGASRRAPQPL